MRVACLVLVLALGCDANTTGKSLAPDSAVTAPDAGRAVDATAGGNVDSGEGQEAGEGKARVTVSPPSMMWTDTFVGRVADVQFDFSVTNPTGRDIEGLSVVVEGDPAFSFVMGRNTCQPTLAPAAKCMARVMFMPAAVGAVEGRIAVNFKGAAAPVLAPLSGTGTRSP